MNIVVFGFSEFTSNCIKRFIKNGYKVLNILPKQKESYVYQYGLNAVEGYSFYIYNDFSDQKIISQLKSHDPEYIYSIVFGDKITKQMTSCAHKYALNVHPTDLPSYRTGNAWFWPLRKGERQSAISVHLLEDEWDSGDIVYKKYFDLHEFETQGNYIDKVNKMYSECIDDLCLLMQKDLMKPEKQEGDSVYYPRVRVGDIFVDFNESAFLIESLVRACNPNHFAEVSFRGRSVGLVEVDVTDIESTGLPGEVVLHDSEMYVAASDYLLKFNILFDFNRGLFSGKRFAAYYQISSGSRFESFKDLFSPEVLAKRL